MSIREKFNRFAEKAQGVARGFNSTIGAVNSTVGAVNEWKRKTGFADPERLEHLGINWGMSSGPFGYDSHKPKRKSKRHRNDDYDGDSRDIHIHINVPRSPRYRY